MITGFSPRSNWRRTQAKICSSAQERIRSGDPLMLEDMRLSKHIRYKMSNRADLGEETDANVEESFDYDDVFSAIGSSVLEANFPKWPKSINLAEIGGEQNDRLIPEMLDQRSLVSQRRANRQNRAGSYHVFSILKCTINSE